MLAPLFLLRRFKYLSYGILCDSRSLSLEKLVQIWKRRVNEEFRTTKNLNRNVFNKKLLEIYFKTCNAKKL